MASFFLRRIALPTTWVAVTLVLVLLPALGMGVYEMRQVVLVATMALIVSGLNLSFGYAGELALGQAAVYAAGAYVTAYVAANIVNDALLTMALGGLVAVALGLLTGVPGLRLGGWLLAVASFFLVLLVRPVLNIIGDPVGGYEGFVGIPLAAVFGRELDDRGYYILVVLTASAWFLVFRNLVTSTHGDAMRVLKTSPVLAESLGIARFSMKLKAYAIGAVPAGIAGTLTAYLDGYIAPESFGLDFAISVLAASILGGSTSVYGAILGSAIIVLIPMRLSTFQEYAFVAYGVLLVAGGVLLRSGIVGLTRAVWQRVRPAGAHAPSAVASSDADVVPRRIEGQPLTVTDVGKRFGGNQALSEVSFTARPGQVTALIGPNGSGKTTLLNMISGFYQVDEGTVRLGSVDLTPLTPPQVARAGVGRTFQTPLVPEDMTVEGVVVTGMYSSTRQPMATAVLRTPGHFRRDDERRARAAAILHELGLSDQARTNAASLALGTRRMLELARVLAGDKSLVLLDEVASGLDENEVLELAAVVDMLRSQGATVVLVEHNFALVKQIADVVVVLADGKVIATGTPAEVEADEDVARLYLGEGAEITGTRAGVIPAGGAV